MRKINFIFAIILISLLLLSIASIAFSQSIKKTFELPEFKSISVNSNYVVYLKQTNKQEVIAEALPEIMELTTVVVDNGVLMVNVERKPDNPNKSVWSKIDDIKIRPTMKLYVSVKSINDLQVNGGGKIISENSIASDYLTLSVSGSGSMDLDIKGNTLKTDISGSGNIVLKGYASSNQITLSGSGTLNAFTCELESAKIKTSGSGSAELNVTTTLEALILGSGVVKHKGNTKSVTKKVYGSGSVDRAY
jgi:Putative auto-transporter adhesin, head GIN domain